MHTDLTHLNERFSIDSRLTFAEGPGGLPTAHIASPYCRASICLYGGHVLHWEPVGCDPVIFLSERSSFTPGQPIRGGIPICWPWFADHPDRPDLPLHGLVRTRFWQVIDTAELPDGSVVVALEITDDDSTRKLWPHPFRLELTATFGIVFDLELVTTNLSDSTLRLTEALHSYFRVADAERVRVRGLDGAVYIDKADAFTRKTQVGPVEPVTSSDSVYLNSEQACLIEDPSGGRRICIAKRGSRSTVVFNPGPECARDMTDLTDTAWRQMVCVETANALDNMVEIEAGQLHRLGATIALEPQE